MPDISGAVAAKWHKAERYAKEQDRFHLESLKVTMRSEHAQRQIDFESGSWSCTCDFFARHSTCSHVMALILILREQANLHLHDELE